MRTSAPRKKVSQRTAKRDFADEAHLVRHLLKSIGELFGRGSANVRVISELPVGGERPDVLVARWTGSQTLPEHPLSALESTVLASLRVHGRTRIDLLEKRCYLGAGGLRDGQLASLFEQGLLASAKGGVVDLASEWASTISVVAIEAKIAKWQRALDQARSYTRYANHSYVAMPAKSGAGRWADELAPEGIGFLQVSKQSVDELAKPCEFVAHDWRREYILSRIVLRGDVPLG